MIPPLRSLVLLAALLLTGCNPRALLPSAHSASVQAAGSAPVNYHRKLEPDGRVVLHGAGQTDDKTFRDYTMLLVQQRPMLYMSYLDLRDNIPAYFTRLNHDLNLYPDYLVPQLGLSLNQGAATLHYDAAVASGSMDKQLADLCTGLKSLDRPVFLRIGYEFNAPWNGYAPDTYIAAFRHIATTLRACQANAVALVWDFAPAGGHNDYMSFYPGDDFVDWWAINLFDAPDLTGPTTIHFLNDAAAHRFPVMIGESTPRGIPVTTGAQAIHDWYQPYFDLIHRFPQIKAFSYINWDWRIYPQWSTWGDARIQDNPAVQSFYLHELNDPIYQPAAGRDATLRILHAESLLTPPAPKQKGPAASAAKPSRN